MEFVAAGLLVGVPDPGAVGGAVGQPLDDGPPWQAAFPLDVLGQSLKALLEGCTALPAGRLGRVLRRWCAAPRRCWSSWCGDGDQEAVSARIARRALIAAASRRSSSIVSPSRVESLTGMRLRRSISAVSDGSAGNACRPIRARPSE